MPAVSRFAQLRLVEDMGNIDCVFHPMPAPRNKTSAPVVMVAAPPAPSFGATNVRGKTPAATTTATAPAFGASDVRNRLGERLVTDGGTRGGRCFKCSIEACPFRPQELRCFYHPCTQKVHVTATCHDLTKRCRLPVCQGQRGHRSFVMSILKAVLPMESPRLR